MSVCDSGESRVIENTDTVHVAAASVSDAEGLEHRFNVRSCDVEEESLHDGDLLKGMLTDTFCQVCEAVLLFESQRNSHYEGKRHAQRVRRFLKNKKAECNKQSKDHSSFQNNADPQKFCELCNMVFSSPVVAKSHYMGKIHAKNMKKYNATCSLVKSLVPPDVAPKPVVEVSTQSMQSHEQKEESAAAAASQGVDLNDPDRYCKLCVASFNNPLMAQQHYSGRKHQRNEARQQPGETPEQVNSLTCPLCHVTLSSVELYQDHMQNNKHHTKEIKVAELSQKKVYDSFQDELADYIQAQRARGLAPKTGQGPDAQQQEGHQEDDGAECKEEPQFQAYPSHLPPPPFRPHLWQPPQRPPMSFRGRFPSPGYSTYPPPLIPGLTGRSLRMWKKRRDSSSSFSSSFSDSSTSSYSSSSESNRGEDAADRRKRKRRKDRKRKAEQDESAENVQRGKRRRRERDTRKYTRHEEKTHRERGMKEKPEDKHGKKRPDEDEEERSNVPVMEDMGREDEEGGIREETKEKKVRHKKDKKKPKPTGDDRTEEEKLWDETILGVF